MNLRNDKSLAYENEFWTTHIVDFTFCNNKRRFSLELSSMSDNNFKFTSLVWKKSGINSSSGDFYKVLYMRYHYHAAKTKDIQFEVAPNMKRG